MRFLPGGAASYLRCAAAERPAPCRGSALGRSRELTDSATNGQSPQSAFRPPVRRRLDVPVRTGVAAFRLLQRDGDETAWRDETTQLVMSLAAFMQSPAAWGPCRGCTSWGSTGARVEHDFAHRFMRV